MLLQCLFICIVLSFSDFVDYHIVPLAAQLLLWFYSLFPFKLLRVAATGLLGLSVLCLGLLLVICTVRSWRYFFFPVKEQLMFTIQCVCTIPFVLAQLSFMFVQSKSLLEDIPPRFLPKLYKNTIYIMFFHDFVYAWALAPFGGIYILFAFTHFIVHTIMLALTEETTKPLLWVFRLLWGALLVQHSIVLWNLFEYTMVRGLTAVYMVTAVMYLTNSYLQDQKRTSYTSTAQ